MSDMENKIKYKNKLQCKKKTKILYVLAVVFCLINTIFYVYNFINMYNIIHKNYILPVFVIDTLLTFSLIFQTIKAIKYAKCNALHDNI